MKIVAAFVVIAVLAAGCVQKTGFQEPDYAKYPVNVTEQWTQQHEPSREKESRQYEAPPPAEEAKPQQKGAALPPCSGTPFTVSPVRLEDIYSILPLGNVNPTGGHVFPTQHIYFHVDAGGTSTSKKTSVYSPGDVSITRISSSEDLTKGRSDWSIEFKPCSEVNAYFHHMSSVSEKIKQQFSSPDRCESYTTGGSAFRLCNKEVDIRLETGEIIGTVGGPEALSTALDLGVYDERTPPLAYANPSRYRYRPELLRIACPLDYFDDATKDKLKSLLGYGGQKRTIEPVCGEAMQDIAGTAQGNWFAKGTIELEHEDPHLALIHDNVDPKKALFSVGTSAKELKPGTYYFTPKSTGTTNRDFSEIKDSKTYCFETEGRFGGRTSGIILLQLTSPTTLRIEKQDGSCSGSLSFSGNYAEFER